jgi:hypothetical protein
VIKLHSESLDADVTLEKDLLYPLVSGTDVDGYSHLPNRQFILFPYDVENESAGLINIDSLQQKFPRITEYLLKNKKRLEEREKGKFKGSSWYRFGRTQNLGIQNRIKLCVPRLVEKLNAGYDEHGNHFLDNVDVGGVTLSSEYTNHDLKYLQSLLNSKLLQWYFPFVSAPFRGGWYSANKQFLSQLPIRTINFSDPVDKARHDRMVSLVTQMLDLNKKLQDARVDHEKTLLQRQIDATDATIDKLVYELYGLTDEEIRIVEGREV